MLQLEVEVEEEGQGAKDGGWRRTRIHMRWKEGKGKEVGGGTWREGRMDGVEVEDVKEDGVEVKEEGMKGGAGIRG